MGCSSVNQITGKKGDKTTCQGGILVLPIFKTERDKEHVKNNCLQCDLCDEIMLRAMQKEWLAGCEVRRASGGPPSTVYVWEH